MDFVERDRAQEQPLYTEPHLKFRLRRDDLIIESNEQGFSVANVYAICATGQSSKVGDSETTGEKGLGFKSVFGIADEVHIQSGWWSFCFKHSKRDDGLGMVSPIWMGIYDKKPGIRTKITLRYSDTSPKFQKALLEKFDELPGVSIMFLRQLEKITIVFEGVEHKVSERTITRNGSSINGELSIVEATDGQEVKHEYKTVTHTVTDMPEEVAREGQRDSTVTLAFPIDSDSRKPSISKRGQYVCAYLPIQRIPQIPVCQHASSSEYS